jgi:hypothetical protein
MLLDAKAEAKRDEMARCKPIQQVRRETALVIFRSSSCAAPDQANRDGRRTAFGPSMISDERFSEEHALREEQVVSCLIVKFARGSRRNVLYDECGLVTSCKPRKDMGGIYPVWVCG